MTKKYMIIKGDTTTHGGTVLEGSPLFTVDGAPVACVSHNVYCPTCKGNFPIIAGTARANVIGLHVAIDGMKTACGAELISSQRLSSVDVDDAQPTFQPFRAAQPTPQHTASSPENHHARFLGDAQTAGHADDNIRRLNGEKLGEAFSQSIRLFQTRRRPGLADGSTHDTAPDLIFGDKTEVEILALAPSFSTFDSNEFAREHIPHHFSNMARLFSLSAWGDLSSVAQEWINKFKRSDGGSFYSTVLTNKVKNHENTVRFVESVKNELNEFLIKEHDRNESIISTVAEHIQEYVMDQRLPKFNRLLDRANGQPF